jgi:hypothetical protein
VGITGLLTDIYLCFDGSQELVIYFLHFPLNSVLIYFFEDSGFHTFFFPSLHLVLCNYVLDRLVCDFNCLLFSLDLIFVCD